MKVYDKLLKPIKEVNYLRAENVDRYRLIIRYFFLEYEKIHYWLHIEDIYSEIHALEGYHQYTLEQCQQDLQMLTQWGNLTATQDSNKVKTIEDFKNRKYRYQLSEYTVEIERMTLKLENLEIEGASLEPSLLERIYQQLLLTPQMIHASSSEVNGWLNLLMNDFIRLNQNYQDYIKTLNSAKAEELMKTTEFLLYKDKIILYLRTFVMIIQEKGSLISSTLKSIDDECLEEIFTKATQYELSIPRIGIELDEADVFLNYKEKWNSLKAWFVGNDGINEVEHLYDISNEIIRKMTRYAQQIADLINRGSNRKEQYLHIAHIFSKCQDINEAHKMSSFVFGVKDCLHLKNIKIQGSEDINLGVYEDKPSFLSFEPHSRIVRKKTIRESANDYTLEKNIQRLELQNELDKQLNKINNLIINHEIDFSSLPKIDPKTRKTLLSWLSKALGQENGQFKTDDGRIYYVDKTRCEEYCTIHCTDGSFLIPKFKIVFKE